MGSASHPQNASFQIPFKIVKRGEGDVADKLIDGEKWGVEGEKYHALLHALMFIPEVRKLL